MKTSTQIVPIQKETSSIVPKPTKTQIIDAMVEQVLQNRIIENKKRLEKQEEITKKIEAAFKKFIRKTIRIEDLSPRLSQNGGYILVSCHLERPQEIVLLNEQMKRLETLTENRKIIREEVEQKIKAEMVSAILEQPGVRDSIKSAIAKLGI